MALCIFWCTESVTRQIISMPITITDQTVNTNKQLKQNNQATQNTTPHLFVEHVTQFESICVLQLDKNATRKNSNNEALRNFPLAKC